VQCCPVDGRSCVLRDDRVMSDNDSVRLFLAAWPNAGVRAELAAARDAWRWPPGARPVVDANLHLTLHYLGEVARERVAALASALVQVDTTAMTLQPQDAEVWKGGIAVLRIDADPALLALHARLGDVLSGAGTALDRRPFAPHVTLARKARGAEPPRERADLAWQASGFALVESVRGRVATYRVLHTFGAS
jgi:2'-5' RNA ligase